MQGKTLTAAAMIALLIGGCATTDPDLDGGTTATAEARALTALELESRANAEQGPTRNETLLQAGQQRLASGQFDAAMATLNRLEPGALSEAQGIRARLLRAQALQGLGDLPAAIDALQASPSAAAPSALQIDFYRLRAELYEAAGEPIAAAEQRIWIDTLLIDPAVRRDNQAAILNTLGQASSTALRELALQRGGTTLGWINLVRLLRAYPAEHTLSPADLAPWRAQHPQHPADITAMQAALPNIAGAFEAVDRIALLIPESGPLEAVGRALREGFLAAHFSVPAAERPAVSIIDTSIDSDIKALYQRLVAEEVDRVVGPLGKDQIAELATLPARPVPVLAMNALQNDPRAHEALYQFGLLPEHDAVNLAERVVRDGFLQAAVLVPKNASGQRIASAFTKRLQELGGQVIAQGNYDPDSFDHGQVVSDMLGIDESEEAKEQRTTLVDDKPVVADPVPNEDIQALVIAAYPQQARLIRPLLKFYYAAHLPTYANSQIYTGTADPLQDKDLNGLIFADLPWVLYPNRFGELSRERIERDFPFTRSAFLRLFALGADAYRLAADERRFEQLEGDDGLTGRLSIAPGNRIHRELAWAQFDDGLAVAETLSAPALPETDETTIRPALRR